MYLEDSDGKIIENPTEAQLVSVLNLIGGGLDHCVLTFADSTGREWFVQTAGSKAGLLLQYSDASGQYESTRSDFDVATVGRVFLDAAKGVQAWKKEFAFRQTDGPEQASAPTGSREPDRQAAGGERSFKDQLLDAVTNGSLSSAGSIIRKGVKSIFRRMF
jgi:hypothetical protein